MKNNHVVVVNELVLCEEEASKYTGGFAWRLVFEGFWNLLRAWWEWTSKQGRTDRVIEVLTSCFIAWFT